MASWIPTNISKKLLRYILSYSGILDPESLNLESLDLALGFKNSVELRDVRLDITKVTKLLHLPPELQPCSGTISRLRIEVPTSFWNSATKVHVSGIEIHIKINKTQPQSLSGNLPTFEDVAKHFLDEEPENERQELEAAILSHSTANLDEAKSQASEDEEFGTGQPMPLSGWIASAIKGIIDRLELHISDVALVINFDALDPNEEEVASSLRLQFDTLEIEGVTSRMASHKHVKKRQIHLKQLKASLASTDTLFESLQLQRVPTSPSQPRTQSSPALSRQPSIHASIHSPASAEQPNLTPSQHDRFADASDDDEEEDDMHQLLSNPFPPPTRFTSSITDTESGLFPLEMDISGLQASRFDQSQMSLSESQTPAQGLQLRPPLTLDRYQAASSDSGSSIGEDMIESRYFSHEEAQSMYQSAMSEVHKMSKSQRSTAEPSPSLTPSAINIKLPDTDISQPKACQPDDVVEASTPTPGSPIDPPQTPQKTPSPQTPVSQLNPPPSKIVTKELLSIDEIALLVPWASQDFGLAEEDDALSSTSGEKSSYFEMPGAFSTHHMPSSPTNIPPVDDATGDLPTPQIAASQLLDTLEFIQHRADVEVVMGFIDGQLDLSSGKVLLSLVDQILQSVAATQSESVSAKPTASDATRTTDSMVIQSVNIHMKGVRVSVQEMMEAPGVSLPPLALESKLMLETERNIISIDLVDPEAGLSCKVHDFAIGFPNQKILSFATPIDFGQVAPGASTFLPGSDKCDIFIQYQSTENRGPELHINTGALYVDIDLPKIDEKLNCYGGLSGILDISTSIISHSTILKSPTRQSTRPDSSEVSADITDAVPKPSLKVNSRITGFKVNITGKQHSIGLESNTVRGVFRDGNIRLKAGHIWTSGPFDHSKPLITLQDPELIFSFAPQESDLDTLISLINPTRDPYEDEEDIMLDILLRQRKKGSLLRCMIRNVQLTVEDIDVAAPLQDLAQEGAKFANVTKYLPEDDRPGILSLALIEKVGADINMGSTVGTVTTTFSQIKIAHVGLPSLLAFQVGELESWTESTDLLKPLLNLQEDDHLPMIMAKMIGDELEPTAKIKLFNLGVEYRVSTLVAFMGLAPKVTSTEDLAASMIQSVATLRGRSISGNLSQNEAISNSKAKPFRISILLRDCAVGLNPTEKSSKGLLLITDAHAQLQLPASRPIHGSLDLRKASLLAIDDTELVDSDLVPAPRDAGSTSSLALTDLERQGFVSLVTIQSTIITLHPEVSGSKETTLAVDIAPEVVIIETCADSTQTMIEIFDGLKPPSAPETTPHYRTDAMLPQDLMNEFSGEEFEQPEQDELADSSIIEDEDEMKAVLSDDAWDMIGSFYSTADDEQEPNRRRSRQRNQSHSKSGSFENHGVPFANGQFARKAKKSRRYHSKRQGIDISVDDTPPAIKSWNSSLKSQDRKGPLVLVSECPLRLTLRVTTFVWNLFDGYDWFKTREVIGQAVERIRQRAADRRSNRRRSNSIEDGPSSEIGDTLFQSIWISVPADRDGEDLGRRIDRKINKTDESTDASTTTALTLDRTSVKGRGRSFKLGRSRRHKASIEIRSLNLDLKILPPNKVETQSVINIEVEGFEIYDHILSSTFRKFLTRLRDATPKPQGTSMLFLTIQNVKPSLDLAATELVISVLVTPIRLHVDQDTLDFITRFFEFKPESDHPPPPKGEQPFIQRIEVFDVPLSLDYKPKKVDYTGLRSGRTKELANFVNLSEANMVLRHVILFGILGFDKLHGILNDIWVADITRRQLPGVLSGLAPIRPIVNVGQGIRQLIVVPLAEYQKDGNIVRSVRKGAFAFAKQTSVGLARLGAHVAMGTGTLLSNAEALLSPDSQTEVQDPYNTHSRSPSRSPTRAVSLYANQPLTLLAGLRSAVRHLERDLTTAKDAIIGVGADLRESENAGDVARAIGRAAPVVILKPAIGASKAIGSALLGAGNALDRESRGRLEDKYK